MTSFAPTAEQALIVELARTGDDLVVQAGAGTGKTATLKLIADALPEKTFQYVAFNRDIVLDSKAKMPRNVRCNTAHSLAMREVGHKYSHRIPAIRMKPTEIARRLGTESIRVNLDEEVSKLVSATYIAGLAVRACRQFCQSADPEPTERHVPFVKGIDEVGDFTNNRIVARHVLPYVRKVWADWTNPQGALPYDHAAYLKEYQLSHPRLGVKVILFDECQDANPVMLDIINRQTHAQRIYVGDSAQQIYSFTGAVDALARIEEQGCKVAFLSKSFRFGPAVAHQANKVLEMIPDTPLRLTGFEQIESRVGTVPEPRAILTRTNAVAMRNVLNALKDGRKPALVGGTGEIVWFAKAAQNLQNGLPADHPELGCFDSWDEVRRYVAEDELGGDLKLFVDLVEEFGVEEILDGLNRASDERYADVIVSTAHKSKGREWDTVRLGEDFPEDRAKAGPEELRLLYVACTRAKLVLDIDAVTILNVVSVKSGQTVEATVVTDLAGNMLGGQLRPAPTPDDDPAVVAARAAFDAGRPVEAPAATDGSPAVPELASPENGSQAQRGPKRNVWLKLESKEEAAALYRIVEAFESFYQPNEVERAVLDKMIAVSARAQ